MVRLAPSGTVPTIRLQGRSLDMMVAGTPASDRPKHRTRRQRPGMQKRPHRQHKPEQDRDDETWNWRGILAMLFCFSGSAQTINIIRSEERRVGKEWRDQCG